MRSLPAQAAGSFAPVTLASNPSRQADSIMSSALPCGMPSMMSTITTSAVVSPSFARVASVSESANQPGTSSTPLSGTPSRVRFFCVSETSE